MLLWYAASGSVEGLPFNPLIPLPKVNPRTGELFNQVRVHISDFVSVLSRTCGMGDVQTNSLQEAILEVFEGAGINVDSEALFNEEQTFPNFDQVGDILRESNRAAFSRLNTFFSLNIFRQEFSDTPFSDLLNKSIIISLKGIGNEKIQDAIMELIILSAYNYYNIHGTSEVIRHVFVIDEANRIVESKITEEFVRQCRKFGVSTILSSQYLDEFKDTITNSMGTKMFHTTGGGITHAKKVTDLIGLGGQEEEVLNLNKFELFLDNTQNRHSRTRIINYPMYLIHSYLKVKKEATIEEVSNIQGIESARVTPLLEQLEKLGLVQIESDRIVLIDRNN